MGDILEFTHDKDECSPQIHMDEDDGKLCPVCESQTLSEALMIQGSKWRVERVQTRHIVEKLLHVIGYLAEDNDTYEDMEADKIVQQAETWMKDHPEVKIV